MTADICLILEGTYPYVRGGVSGWVHDLILQHPDYTFSLICLTPKEAVLKPVYEIPKNVLEQYDVRLQSLPARAMPTPSPDATSVAAEIAAWMEAPSTATFAQLHDDLKKMLSEELWTASPFGWQVLKEHYAHWLKEGPFLDFFWTWRMTMLGLLSVLAAPMAKARCYHALCTGYAGLYLARAHAETGNPCLLTEHGIYTNERQIEIASAEWLDAGKSLNFVQEVEVENSSDALKTYLSRFFRAAAATTYDTAAEIITLYEDNIALQQRDGAERGKIKIIPNGIDTARFEAITPRAGRPPTVALIGRVVPIKDVKTFIRAVSLLRQQIPDIHALVVGGTEEDPVYAAECEQLVASLHLQDHLLFTGQQDLTELLPEVDVMVLTSLSEAQPLVILEAGAAGIPFVATNVGSCRELILGRGDEQPAFGIGGMICPPGSPQSVAAALKQLLHDDEMRLAYGQNLKKRVLHFYRREQQQAAYQELYEKILV